MVDEVVGHHGVEATEITGADGVEHRIRRAHAGAGADRHDAVRDDAARASRSRILDAAEALLHRSGYHGMTVGALASAAGVSPQTVYNSVGSKAAVLKALYDVRLAGLVGLVAAEGAGRDSELAAFLDTIERERRIGNGHLVTHLESTFGLPDGLEPEVAVDILWTLTALDVADRLVRRCGWTMARYETWLGDAMVAGVCGVPASGSGPRRRGR